jgi:rubrerythrin
MSDQNLKTVLEFALKREDESIQLYTLAQNIVNYSSSKEFLKDLVREEIKHKNKILKVLKNPTAIEKIGYSDSALKNLKVVEYLVDIELSADADYQQILIFAAKKEKKAHDFYIDLATRYNEKDIGNLFTRLAKEELKHKYMLELQYDDVVLRLIDESPQL